LPRATAAKRRKAGFTLIEVLVALAIVAISLSSIGTLIATTVRGTRTIEGNVARLEIARAIATALPDRDQLAPGDISGEIAHHRWHVRVSPFVAGIGAPQQQTPWVPQAVVITVHSPAGAPMQISTIRLHRRAGG
jgi:general secretion pathway protein I